MWKFNFAESGISKKKVKKKKNNNLVNGKYFPALYKKMIYWEILLSNFHMLMGHGLPCGN